MSFGQLVIAGNANTIQFPPISPNGLGIFTPSVYGQKHIAIPNPSVRVGATYNLNCDFSHLNIAPTPVGEGGHTGIGEAVGNANTGNPCPNV